MARRKKMHVPKGLRRDFNTVRAMSAVQYDPQVSALSGLIKGARKTYRGDIAVAKASALGTSKAAKRAVKPVKKIYRNSLGDIANAREDVKTGFKKLGDAADPYRAVTAREDAGYRSRVAGERASALKELSDRQLEAKAGQIYAIRAATANRNDTLGTLRGRLSDLYHEKGAYEAGQLGQMANDAAQRRNARRLARIQSRGATRRAKLTQAGENKRAADKIAADKIKNAAKAKKDSRASRSDQRMFSTEYGRLAALATGNRLGNTRADLARQLSTGVSGVSPAKNGLALQVALDMAYRGYVSPAHARRMRRTGMKLSDVPGLVSPKSHRRAKRRQNARSPASYGAQHG
jgi:hypothetical protein